MKITKKKLIIIIIAIILLILLCACAISFFVVKQYSNKAVVSAEEVPARKQDNFNVFILQYGSESTLDRIFEGIVESFKETDKVVNVDYINANFSQENCNTAITNIITPIVNEENPQAEPVVYDLIIAIGNAPAISVLTIEMDIPILICGASDPLEIENIDGYEIKNEDVVISELFVNYEDAVQMMVDFDSDINFVGVLYNKNDPLSIIDVNNFKEVCESKNIAVKDIGISDAKEIGVAFKSLSTVDAIHTLYDSLILDSPSTMIKQANKIDIPLYTTNNDLVSQGALASSGVPFTIYGKSTGTMALDMLITGSSSVESTFSNSDIKTYVNSDVANLLSMIIPAKYRESATILITY